MGITENLTKEQWNNFVKSHPKGNVTQSWQWGEFVKQLGNKVWRLAIQDGTKILGAAQIIEYEIALGSSFFYCPGGPLLGGKGEELLIVKIRELASQTGAVFLRIEIDFDGGGQKKPQLLGGFKSPAQTLVLDLRPGESDILAQMKQKTRYNIRLAEKKGVKVREVDAREGVEIFYKLAKEMMSKNKVGFFPKSHYEKLGEVLGKEGLLKIFVGEFKGEPLAAIIVSFWGPRATYMHGASTDKLRELQASHLVQWEAIGEAKKMGCKQYDFWGIAVRSEKRKVKSEKQEYKVDEGHPWAGITRFKLGFGGKLESFYNPQDIVFSNTWYNLFSIAAKARKIV